MIQAVQSSFAQYKQYSHHDNTTTFSSAALTTVLIAILAGQLTISWHLALEATRWLVPDTIAAGYILSPKGFEPRLACCRAPHGITGTDAWDTATLPSCIVWSS